MQSFLTLQLFEPVLTGFFHHLKVFWSLCALPQVWKMVEACVAETVEHPVLFLFSFLRFFSEFIPHSCITCQKVNLLVFHLNHSFFRTGAYLYLLDFFPFIFLNIVQECFLLLQCNNCLHTDCCGKQETVRWPGSSRQTQGWGPTVDSLRSFFKWLFLGCG